MSRRNQSNDPAIIHNREPSPEDLLRASVADPEAAVPNEPAASIQCIVEEQPDVFKKWVDAHERVRIETAACALEMQGDICDARDLRNGLRDQGLMLRAEGALRSIGRDDLID